MEILSKSILTEHYDVENSEGENDADLTENYRNQVTPQYVIDSLPCYVVRPNGAYSQPENFCGICYSKYRVADKITCLPCQHNFHDYCIENWLKWVKSSCPVDKKSVVRRQYREELIKERQNRILDLKIENESLCSSSLSEGLRFCAEAKTLSCDRSPEKVTRNKEIDPIFQKSKLQRCCSPKFLSPVGHTGRTESVYKQKESRDVQVTPSKNMSPVKQSSGVSERHDIFMRNITTRDTMSRETRHRLQESVEAIKRSIKSRNLKVKKYGNPEEFQKALQKVVTKLSKTNIDSPKMTDMQIRSRYVGNLGTISPLQKDEFQRHVSLRGIMGNKGLTFSDFLEIEKEISSGWMYKRAALD